MVKLILYSLLTGCNAFISTNEIVLMKAENVLKGVGGGGGGGRERERRWGKKKKRKETVLGCLKSRYCTVKRGSSRI